MTREELIAGLRFLLDNFASCDEPPPPTGPGIEHTITAMRRLAKGEGFFISRRWVEALLNELSDRSRT